MSRRLGRSLRALYRLPNAARRRRHIDAVDAEWTKRIDNRIDDDRGSPDGAGFADAFHADRIGLAPNFLQRDLEIRHHVCARHRIVHKAARDELRRRAVVDGVFIKRLPDALRNAAMLLAVDDHRIQHLSEIIDHDVAVDRDLSGLRVDLDLHRMCAVWMAWRLGRMTAGAFEPYPKSGHRPHRREGCLRYFDEWDGLVGASNLEVAVLEFDVTLVCLQ